MNILYVIGCKNIHTVLLKLYNQFYMNILYEIVCKNVHTFMKQNIWIPRVFLTFLRFFKRILYKSNCIIFIFSWCGTHTKIRSKLVVIVTAWSQKITLWGPQRTPLGILRVKLNGSVQHVVSNDVTSLFVCETERERERETELIRSICVWNNIERKWNNT